MLFPNVLPEMLQADYWINRLALPQKTILTLKQIDVFNQNALQNLPATLYDLAFFPAVLPKEQLQTWILATPFPAETLYHSDGQPLTQSDYTILQSRLNVNGLTESNPVRYGFTIRRTNLRTFPTDAPVLEDQNRPEFDRFQETGLDPAEPVLILHQSPDGDWFLIQTASYRGWVVRTAIGVAASKEQWLNYLNTPEFLIVTGPGLTVASHSATQQNQFCQFEMGAKIPLASGELNREDCFTAQLPDQTHHNQLTFPNYVVSKPAEVHKGYLNYTRANLIRQAFKMLGHRYDWGGLHGSVDCSSFIRNSYRCFGFIFPRNSGQQAQLPGQRIDLSSLNITDKKAALSELPPGATLFMPGHVMFYLGTINDCFYILHALSSYGVRDETGNIKKVYHLQVDVTDLSLLRANGQTFLEALTTAMII